MAEDKINPGESRDTENVEEFDFEGMSRGERKRHQEQSESLRRDRELREKIKRDSIGRGMLGEERSKKRRGRFFRDIFGDFDELIDEKKSVDDDKEEGDSITGKAKASEKASKRNKTFRVKVKTAGRAGADDASYSSGTASAAAANQNRNAGQAGAMSKPVVRVYGNEPILAPVLTAVIILLVICSDLVDTAIIKYNENIYLSVIILSMLSFLLPTIFFCRIKGSGYISKLNLRLFPPRMIPFTLWSLAVMLSGGTIIKLLMYASGTYSGDYQVYSYIIPNSMALGNAVQTAYAVIACAVLPAVCEELVFRSVLISEYAKGGAVCAVIATTLLSAFPYLRPEAMPLYIFYGLILGTAACVTRSVAAPLIIHVAVNCLELSFEQQLGMLIRQTSGTVVYSFIIVITFFIFLFLAFGEAERIYSGYAVSRHSDVMPRGSLSSRLIEAMLSPTMIICLFLYVAGIIVRAIG